MNKIYLNKFFKDKYVNYASYDNLRKIASYVDGLKNSSRKVIRTILDKNICSEIKVSQLDSKTAEYCEYLHGSMVGVITGLAEDYPGTNNLPLIYPEGNFGTRFSPIASAPRYIYTYKQKYTDLIFKKEDTDILIKQYFEGVEIEPMFYMPTLPILLINGSENPSSGFAQKILPRNPINVIKVIKSKLNNTKFDQSLLNPKYDRCNCVVKQDDINKWSICGVVQRVSVARVRISEIPINISLKKYITILDKIEERGIIKSYKDNSDNNKFSFDIQLDSKLLSTLTDDELLDKLDLVKRVTENYTCIDENNKIRVFNTAEEIVDAFIKIKLEYTEKRKQYQLSKMRQDLKIMLSKAFFIMSVIKGDIIVNNKSKTDIIGQLTSIDRIIKIDDSYEYLLRMPIYTLTKDKVQELKESVNNMKESIKELDSINSKDIWLSELTTIETYLKKHK